MALPDYGRIQSGTNKTFKSAGGTAAITLASLANNSARQSVKADMGATRGSVFKCELDIEMAATPTAGNVIEVYGNPSSSSTAATDNKGGCSGTDIAYTGYSSNLDASLKHLDFIGSLVCTTQITSTVQKGVVGYYTAEQRFLSVVVYNKAGSAVHSSDSNCELRFIPVEDVAEDT